MDPATRGTSSKKHNLCHAFSSWKISGPLEKLTSAQEQLRLKVNMIIGIKRSEDMHPTKLTWLVETKNLLLQAEILKTEMSDAKQFFLWKQPRGLSDKFARMTMDIRRKLEDADKLEVEPVAGAVGHTVQRKDDQESSSSSSLSLPKNCYILLKSARRATFEIMEAFQDNDVKLIGLVGMGCMGKTALAILMGMKAEELGMFDAVIKVSGRSSEQFRPDLGMIRLEIAKALDPKWNAKEIEKDDRGANELIGELVKKVEKILIILDDVWEVTDLKAFVIPLGKDHKGCKILITTRLRHVCEDFGCQKIVHLEETEEKFDPKLELLPFQTVKLGSNPFRTFHRFMEENETYRSLELNYDYLNDTKKQSLFMLCSHFPREYAPTVEELTRYGIGQGLFNDCESTGSARKAAHSIVSSFQSNLIVEEDEYCVRMCDPFRKLPFLKAPELTHRTLHFINYHQLRKVKNSTTIFLKTSQFPGDKFFKLEFTNLQTLTIIEDDDRAYFYKDRKFGSGSHIVKLNVLCLQAGCFPSGDWAENPPTLSLEGIENLKCLQTLQVKGYKVKGVSSLVKLNKVEILGFIGCTFEDKLPEGLGNLHNLKMLDFSYCVDLHKQPQGWIRELSKLEELYITDVSLEVWSRSCFLQQLHELNSNLSLIVLLREVKSTFCPQQFVVPRFPRYRIELTNVKDGLFSSLKNRGVVGEEKDEVDHFVHFKPISSSKALRIRALPMSPFVELFKDVEYLHLSNAKDCQNIVPSLDKGGLSGLQDLRLHDCENLKYLIDEEVIGGDLMQVCTFSKLTNLELVGLGKLESLWHGGGHMINLGNLKSFRLRDCHNLRGYIFPKSIAQSLAQLEIVEVSKCSDCLKAVFEQCTDDGRVCLPKLATVKISKLLHLQYIFPSYMTERLPQLTELQVSDCYRLEHVFILSNNEVDEENELDRCCHVELPQLRLLVLKQLEYLKNLCQGKDSIAAPLLEELQVHNCPRLQPFTLTLNNDMLPRLKKLCLGSDVGSKVSESDVVKVYTKISKWSTSQPHFIVGTGPFDSRGTYLLSNLKELKLEELNLKVLWKDSTINGLQNLTHLSLYCCWRLEYVFTPLSVHSMPHLKCLSINQCHELGQIVAEDETATEAHGQQHHPLWFPNLTDIEIFYCFKLSDVFPARLADQLPKLKRLRVQGVTSLTQIFGPDRDSKETSNSKVVQLPLLQNLILKGLRNMVRFAPEGLHFTFPALDHLEVRNCTKMQTSFYAAKFQRGACAITESGEIRQSTVEYTQPTNAAVAMPIFSGDNYKPWRDKMMTYFKSQDLWEIVAQGIKAPFRDAQALFVIQNAVLDPIYSKISGATSARDAWLTLENLYTTFDDPHIRKLFSGNEQEAKRWSNAKRLEMDADNNVLWPDGKTASEHEKTVIVDLRDPDGLRALDLI